MYNNLGEVPDETVAALKNEFLAASMLTLKHAFEEEWLLKHALRILLMTESTPNLLQKQFMVYFFGRRKFKKAEIDSLLESVSLNLKSNIMNTLEYYTAKGVEQGIDKAKIEIVKNLLAANRFTIAEIANFANVTEAFVLQVKETM